MTMPEDGEANSAREAVTQLGALEGAIRNRLLDLGGHEEFERRRWYEVVAALDNIGDTNLAIESFLCDPPPGSWGPLYLRLFGMLASVSMQQDSVEFLMRKLVETEPSKGDGWTQLRTLRNKIAAHPAENGGAVQRASLARDSLPVLRWRDGGPKHETVDVRELLLGYLEEVNRLLETLHAGICKDDFRPPDG